jgi:hypothetical protein
LGRRRRRRRRRRKKRKGKKVFGAGDDYTIAARSNPHLPIFLFLSLSLSLYKRYTGYFLLDVKNPGPAVYILNTTHSAHRHPLEGSGGAECRRRRPSVSPRTK